MYKELFEELESLYREAHKNIHGVDYGGSWGNPVYGLRMYRSSEREDEEYILIEIGGISVNKNGTVKFETDNMEEGKMTPSFNPQAFLLECIEVMKTSGQHDVSRPREAPQVCWEAHAPQLGHTRRPHATPLGGVPHCRSYPARAMCRRA